MLRLVISERQEPVTGACFLREAGSLPTLNKENGSATAVAILMGFALMQNPLDH